MFLLHQENFCCFVREIQFFVSNHLQCNCGELTIGNVYKFSSSSSSSFYRFLFHFLSLFCSLFGISSNCDFRFYVKIRLCVSLSLYLISKINDCSTLFSLSPFFRVFSFYLFVCVCVWVCVYCICICAEIPFRPKKLNCNDYFK